MQRLSLIAWAVLILCIPAICPAENWPGFRGPTGLGYTTETNLPLTWGGPENKNVLWKSALAGQGHASPIVWGDSVIVCTVRWAGDGSPQSNTIPDHHVTCYRVADGKMVWDTLIPPGPWVRSDFRSGPGGGYAGPTPATDGKLIYCAFGSSVLAALDFNGKIVWRKEIIPHSFDVTIGGSPVLYQETVFFFCPMAKPDDSKVIAFDKATGSVKWEHMLSTTAFGHSTPVIIDVKGRPQMLVLASGMKVTDDALQSLDPADGHRLWWCRGAGDSASPAYGGGLVYFDSGRNGQGTCVDPTGTGDVSQSHIKWTIKQVPESIGSPTIVDDYVYRLHQPGILKCWELKTGKQVYSQRLEGISTTWASPIADPAGHLFFANAGKSYVIQAGPEFRVLAVNELSDPSHPSAAAAGGRLYLVGKTSVFCVADRGKN